jgi:hypothetical protein
MTKVQRSFRLQRPLDESMLEQLAAVNSIYGIDRIQVSPAGDALTIDYDATRLRVPDLSAALESHGIPVDGVS